MTVKVTLVLLEKFQMKKPKIMLVVAIFAKVPSVEIGNGGLKLRLEALLKGRNNFIV